MYRSLIAALLLALPAIANAETQAPSLSVNVDPAGWLAIGGVAIVQLRDKSVCESLNDRSGKIMSRIVNALEMVNRRGRYKDIRVTVEPPQPGEPAGEPWVAVEGVRVMKVTNEDVAAARQTSDKLAVKYASGFRKALKRIYTP